MPVKEILLTSMTGKEVQIQLWREVALEALEVGKNISVTHIRIKDHGVYGKKGASTCHTKIQVSKFDYISLIHVLHLL